ncbi:WD40-repeat-containing domain protein [Mycena vulgaris]|nr:WD40-repeat-containing domain protein [Mycena vulgaris]
MPRGSRFTHRSPCLPGTRKDILKTIKAWVADLDAPNILWLHGFPGSGKTSIAWSLVPERSPGPHFFFRGDDIRDSTTSALWFTIAAHLAKTQPMFGRFAVENVEKDKSLNSPEIFNHLISHPLKRLESMENIPSLFVVDAIDECGRIDGDRELQALLLSLMEWVHLPRHLKLVITSRYEHVIAEALKPISRAIEVDLRGERASKDIQLFLEDGFRKLAGRYHRSLQHWPAPGVVETLTERAGGLFIWAETLLRFLEHDTEKRLARILNDGDLGTKGLIYKLYRRILDMSFLAAPETPDTGDIQNVLGAIMLSPAPLTFKEYVDCVMPNIEVPGSTFDDICRRLRPVLDNDAPNDLVRFHHQSFPDFLVSRSCPPVLCIELQTQRTRITEAYLRTLRTRLSFNICNLDSSHILNDAVADLPTRIKRHIPDALSHASVRWTDHLAAIHADPLPPSIKAHIQHLFETNFFYWLEVCSLTGHMDECVGQLSNLKDWAAGDVELAPLVDDACKFVETFKDVISTSVPHIYISALPFTPPTSRIFQLYQPRFSGSVSVRLQIALEGGIQHRHPITCVAFSPLGCIASASQDRTICLWTSNGRPMLEPLIGHTRTVTCVSFSEDGKHLVSGSRDQTARVWNVLTGQEIAKFARHTDIVTGVVFSSPRLVASVSRDKSLRIWNSTAEREYMDDSEFSPSPLTSVAALGGNGLAVCSADGMIFTTRIVFQRGGSSQGHGTSAPVGISRESPITCIASSPGGEWLITGDKQGVVTKRDIMNSRDVCTMRGHSERVAAVAASADRIASGSINGTILIWDIDSGELLLGPFRAHSPITSLAFSPDGTKILSSDGMSLRLWDLREIYRQGQVASPFTNGCELQNSWIRNPQGQLVAWVPPEYHDSLLWPRNIANFGKTSISLDFSKTKSWMNCRM